MLYLGSKFVSKPLYWKNYREMDARVDALEKDMCVVADRMKFKRHKVAKVKTEDAPEEDE